MTTDACPSAAPLPLPADLPVDPPADLPADLGPPTPLDPYLMPPDAGFRFRPATTLADAETVRRLVRAAWKLRAPDRYVYDLFERPHDLLTQLIDPLLTATDLRELDAICLLAEQDGEAFGTLSLVLDHTPRTVELGRGAILPTRQPEGRVSSRREARESASPVASRRASHRSRTAGLSRMASPSKAAGDVFSGAAAETLTQPSGRGAGRSTSMVAAILRLLNAFTDYDVIVDATLAQPGTGRVAIGSGALPVGLYPSTFVFQPACLDDWLDALRRTQGAEQTDAMVHRSQSGLGRFMTAYHLRPADRRAPCAPITTPRQAPLAAWTRRALDLPALALTQPDRARPMQTKDLPLTATRTICHAPPELDIDQAMRDALAEGMETLVIRVPCDATHRPLAERLDARDALLGGVHPDRDGRWSAGYVIPLGEGHAAAVRAGLRAMAQRGQPRIYAPLLRVVAEVNGQW